jgi:membrane associated rhomboid family serine protease
MNTAITPVVKNLLIINILVFILANVLSSSLGQGFVTEWLAVYYPESENFKAFQLITYMFMHGSLFHIFFNMIGLYMFGQSIEYVWGPKRFLFYYFFTGFGALALDFLVKYYQLYYTDIDTSEAFFLVNTPMVGASGAIFGLLAAYGYLFPNNIIMPIFPPIPMKAKYFVLVYGAIEVYSGISNMAHATSNIAHFAHVGGALFGLLLILYWHKGGRFGID